MPSEKYQGVVRTIFAVLTTIFVVVLTFIYPYILPMNRDVPLERGSVLMFLVTLSSIYTLLAGGLIWLYENVFWKLHSRRHNYSGYWKMVVRYEFLERGLSSNTLKLPYIFESVFKVDQTCFDFRFAEGFSAPNETWKDESLRLTDAGLNMSYRVHRSDKVPGDALPAEVIGFETIHVQERDGGLPTYMIGRMYHAALPGTCLYRGTTLYTRVSKKEYLDLLSKMKAGRYLTQYEEGSLANAVDVAKLYFEVSNKSDMDAIASMMSATTTYSSANTGVYLGVDQIIAMQTAYHRSFKKLHWDVLSVKEVRPGVVLFDFVFRGEKLTGETVTIAGDEYVIIVDGKIQHVDVRNKQ